MPACLLAVSFVTLLLVQLGCKAEAPFPMMTELAQGAQEYLRASTNSDSVNWREFQRFFPGTETSFEIVANKEAPELVWCSLHAAINEFELTYSVPLYHEDGRWFNRNGRWTLSARDQKGALTWQRDLQPGEWELFKAGELSISKQPGL